MRGRNQRITELLNSAKVHAQSQLLHATNAYKILHDYLYSEQQPTLTPKNNKGELE